MTALPNEIAALDGGAFGGAWVRTGQQFNVYPLDDAPASSSTVWRFVDTTSWTSHFYTANAAEYDALASGAVPGWMLEGPVFNAPLPASNGTCPSNTITIPVYRMDSSGMGGAPDQRLTTSGEDFAQTVTPGRLSSAQPVAGFCSPQ